MTEVLFGYVTGMTDYPPQRIRLSVMAEYYDPALRGKNRTNVFVWYFGKEAQIIQNQFVNMVTKPVILAYNEHNGLYYGKGYPVMNGFIRLDPEMRDTISTDAVTSIIKAYQDCHALGLINLKTLPNWTDLSETAAFYEMVKHEKGPAFSTLRSAVCKIFRPKTYVYLGVVGNIAAGPKGSLIMSVPYHSGTQIHWADVSFWDQADHKNLTKQLTTNSPVLLKGLMERDSYNGHYQFSGKYWEAINKN